MDKQLRLLVPFLIATLFTACDSSEDANSEQENIDPPIVTVNTLPTAGKKLVNGLKQVNDHRLTDYF